MSLRDLIHRKEAQEQERPSAPPPSRYPDTPLRQAIRAMLLQTITVTAQELENTLPFRLPLPTLQKFALETMNRQSDEHLIAAVRFMRQMIDALDATIPQAVEVSPPAPLELVRGTGS